MRSFHRKDRKDDPNSTKKNSSATKPLAAAAKVLPEAKAVGNSVHIINAVGLRKGKIFESDDIRSQTAARNESVQIRGETNYIPS